MLRCVALVRTEVSVERIAPIIRIVRLERTTLSVTETRCMLRLLITVNCVRSSSCHPDDGGDMFLQSVGSHKSHTA
jgi:hypothetical protein